MKSRISSVAKRWRERLPDDISTRQIVVTSAVSMIALQLAFRSWAAYGGWFYGDDLKFLAEAASRPLTLEYLFTRHQQQLMPGGLLISWLVGQGPAWSWPLAATTIVIMQALASGMCLLMLVRLFGWRPGILAPLALYLFSPVTIGAFMWWAAALNQLPLQIAFFGLICAHVAYVRTGGLRWAALSVAVLVVALLFYVKAVVMLPVVVLLTLGWLVHGGPLSRIRSALRTFWPVWIGYAVAAGGYLAFYASTGGSPVGAGGDAAYLATADRQLRETLGPSLLGGPWRWLDPGRQDVLSDAPQFAITLAWLVIAGLVLATCWRRVGAWRGWALLGVYLIPTVYLTASGRSLLFGPDAGLYVRYLTDVIVVAVIAFALVLMPMRGDAPARPRSLEPAISLRPFTAIGAAMFAAGSIWSTMAYVDYWHEESPAERYVATAANDLAALDGLSIIDRRVPKDLVLDANAPYNRPSKLLLPLKKDLQPVTSGTDLRMFGTDGTLGPAFVTPGITADLADGSDCGALVKNSRRVDLDLPARVTNDRWWVSISYLASSDGSIVVRAGAVPRFLRVQEGLHTLMFTSSGSYDTISVQSTTPELGLCVDTTTVGFLDTFS